MAMRVASLGAAGGRRGARRVERCRFDSQSLVCSSQTYALFGNRIVHRDFFWPGGGGEGVERY